jgi:hypothetical protein
MHPLEFPLGWRFDIEGRDAQAPADVAVIIGTVLRPSLLDAIESVYRQDLGGTIQILVGVDKAAAASEPLLELLRARPPNVGALVLNPGYSTSERHGGLHRAHDGGALRTILSYLANSKLLAYLDDDNRWLPNHLSSLARAIAGFDWAYSLRMFVDVRTGADLCTDVWDSVGPGKGIRRDSLGGFVDINCLMIDKSRAEDALPDWTQPLAGSKVTADRRVFHRLRTRHPVAWTGLATVRYAIRPTFFLWPKIEARLRQRAGRSV